MNNRKPINKGAYDKEQEDDGKWKVGDEYYDISDMEDDFLITAYFHSIKKINYHGNRVSNSYASLRKFGRKIQELFDEIKLRGMEDEIPSRPHSILAEAVDQDIEIKHGKAS